MIEFKKKFTYEGIYSEFNEATLIICGIPYDGTCSNRPGTRFGPAELRKEIDGLETYSPYQRDCLDVYRVCDIGDMELPFGNSGNVVTTIYREYRRLLDYDKKILTVGGEHLISYPVIKAHIERYPDLQIIHFDAHADLRDSYLGEKLSHATVMRRVYEEIGDDAIYQFGIRSGTKDEFDFGETNTNLQFNSLNGIESVAKAIGNKPVYLTIDLDVLDPSILPGTGTPEPGGVTFNELIGALLKLKDINIIGADIVELSPQYDLSGVSNVVAAKILREVAIMMAKNETKGEKS